MAMPSVKDLVWVQTKSGMRPATVLRVVDADEKNANKSAVLDLLVQDVPANWMAKAVPRDQQPADRHAKVQVGAWSQ